MSMYIDRNGRYETARRSMQTRLAGRYTQYRQKDYVANAMDNKTPEQRVVIAFRSNEDLFYVAWPKWEYLFFICSENKDLVAKSIALIYEINISTAETAAALAADGIDLDTAVDTAKVLEG